MELTEHTRYRIEFPYEYVNPKGENGEKAFVPPFNREGLKLYVISDGGTPIYVGRTKDPILERLGSGLRPSPNSYGYLWRHYLKEATIDIWILTLDKQDISEMEEDPSMKRAKKDNSEEARIEEIIIETLEAEVVFLIRQRAGKWPKYQSEIHFHQSQKMHKRIAAEIVSHFPKLDNSMGRINHA